MYKDGDWLKGKNYLGHDCVVVVHSYHGSAWPEDRPAELYVVKRNHVGDKFPIGGVPLEQFCRNGNDKKWTKIHAG